MQMKIQPTKFRMTFDKSNSIFKPYKVIDFVGEYNHFKRHIEAQVEKTKLGACLVINIIDDVEFTILETVDGVEYERCHITFEKKISSIEIFSHDAYESSQEKEFLLKSSRIIPTEIQAECIMSLVNEEIRGRFAEQIMKELVFGLALNGRLDEFLLMK